MDVWLLAATVDAYVGCCFGCSYQLIWCDGIFFCICHTLILSHPILISVLPLYHNHRHQETVCVCCALHDSKHRVLCSVCTGCFLFSCTRLCAVFKSNCGWCFRQFCAANRSKRRAHCYTDYIDEQISGIFIVYCGKFFCFSSASTWYRFLIA